MQSQEKKGRGRPRNDNESHALNIRLPDPLYRALKEYSESRLDRPSMSVLIRRFIQRGLVAEVSKKGAA